MSLKPLDGMAIPADTVCVARAIFPNGDNISLRMRDELGSIFKDEQFQELFGRRGKPAESPGRLALVTLLQFAEDLMAILMPSGFQCMFALNYVKCCKFNA